MIFSSGMNELWTDVSQCWCIITGARCETKIPTECSCPPDHQCILENNVSFTYKCVTPPVVATSCDKNATCPPTFGGPSFTISLEQMIGIISAMVFIVFLICSIIICRYVQRSTIIFIIILSSPINSFAPCRVKISYLKGHCMI